MTTYIRDPTLGGPNRQVGSAAALLHKPKNSPAHLKKQELADDPHI